MITITESAKEKIKDLLFEEGNPKLALRTFVQCGGCSGFSYGFTFDESRNEDDSQVGKQIDFPRGHVKYDLRPPAHLPTVSKMLNMKTLVS